MINYTFADFLGIFLIFLPVFVFATTILFWGLRELVDRFFEDETDKTIFHHHFHHKAPRD
jgi:hypothetical protein